MQLVNILEFRLNYSYLTTFLNGQTNVRETVVACHLSSKYIVKFAHSCYFIGTLYHSSLLLCSRCILPLDAWSNKVFFKTLFLTKRVQNKCALVNGNLMMITLLRKPWVFSESSSLFSHSEMWVSLYYLVFYKSLHADEPMGPPENQRSSDSHITCWELFDYPTHEAWVRKMGWCFSFSHGNCCRWLVFAYYWQNSIF